MSALVPVSEDAREPQLCFMCTGDPERANDANRVRVVRNTPWGCAAAKSGA